MSSLTNFIALGMSAVVLSSGQRVARDNRNGQWEVLFHSTFETPADASIWTGRRIQQAAGQPEARIAPSTAIVHGGAQSVRMFAPPRTFDPRYRREFCGKASLKNTASIVREGDTVEFSAWVYLTDPPADAFFFLMDIECTEDECGYMGAPGVRLRISPDAPRLQAEWKFLNYFSGRDALSDPPPKPPLGRYELPVGEWFNVAFVLTLGQGDQGVTEVYVNNRLDSRVVGTNISPGGVLANMTRYDSFEIGLTCNSSGSTPTTIYIDDVVVRRRNS